VARKDIGVLAFEDFDLIKAQLLLEFRHVIEKQVHLHFQQSFFLAMRL
jgi:hypothetical protein